MNTANYAKLIYDDREKYWKRVLNLVDLSNENSEEYAKKIEKLTIETAAKVIMITRSAMDKLQPLVSNVQTKPIACILEICPF